MQTLRVLFAGTPDVAVPSLLRLVSSPHEVVGVLTRPDSRTGRGRKLAPSPVSLAAQELGLAVFTPHESQQLVQVLRGLAVDVVAVVAYGRLIVPQILHVPRFGWINAHFSLLPAWRGAAPVQHAIASGDRETGVTTFRIDEGLDTGPIYLQSDLVSIDDRESTGSLLDRLAPIGAELLERTLTGVASQTLDSVPQSTSGVSFAPRLTSDLARITWDEPAIVVDRWVRACTPSPGAWTTLGDGNLRIGVPTGVFADTHAKPGAIVVESHRVLIGARDGWLVLGGVQAAGKRWMDAADWARGWRGSFPTAV